VRIQSFDAAHGVCGLLSAFRLLRRRERGGELLIQGEEMLHAGAVIREGFLPVAALHGAVEFGMVVGS
jgi:hypothetical protein